MPTMNRKAIATVVGRCGTEQQERALVKLMTHSVDVARRAYQHTGSVEQTVETYEDAHALAGTTGMHTKDSPEPPRKRQRKFFTAEEEEEIKAFFDIETTKTPTSSKCREFLSIMTEKDMFNDRTVHNIQDEVRNLGLQLQKLEH